MTDPAIPAATPYVPAASSLQASIETAMFQDDFAAQTMHRHRNPRCIR
jgi:hypothetical protein